VFLLALLAPVFSVSTKHSVLLTISNAA